MLLGVLALGHRRDLGIRRFSCGLFYTLAALFIFGGVVDALHLLAGGADLSRMTSFFLGTLENGGELVSISVALALVLGHSGEHSAAA